VFQAEDGIRDDLVTGVQTCALPIFNGEFMRGMRECREREVRRRMVGSRCFAKVRAKFDAASGKASVHPWCRVDAGRSELWPPPKIGRASCRERGWHWRGAGLSRENR